MEENKKTLHCAICNNLRLVVQTINSKEISKEDILYIVKENEHYALLYYK